MRRPASAQSTGGLASLNTSEVSLDGTKREVGCKLLTEDRRGPSPNERRDDDNRSSSFEIRAPSLALMVVVEMISNYGSMRAMGNVVVLCWCRQL